MGWSVISRAATVSIEPSENGCRTYECCGGEACGYTAAEAQTEIVAHYQRQADYWREMTVEQFLIAQGYSYPVPAPPPASRQEK